MAPGIRNNESEDNTIQTINNRAVNRVSEMDLLMSPQTNKIQLAKNTLTTRLCLNT